MKLGTFRNVLVYVVFLVVFGFGIHWILNFGKGLEVGIENSGFHSDPFSFVVWVSDFSKNLKHPIALLILQLLVILIVARTFGWILSLFRQPMVIGEIIAGIVLGPSFLGWALPEYSSFLFPKESLKSIQALSQIGLFLFLFLVGMELDVKILGKKAHDAVVVSHASILFPFFLGTAYAIYLYQDFSPKGVSFLVFGLFMGIAMSITAFPVLARIVQERGLTKTSLGTLVVTCAAADDVTAWCILAIVVAVAQAGSLLSGLITIALAVSYVILMIFVIRPLLTKISQRYPSREALIRPVTAFVFIIWLLSCYVAEAIGIHALFGAFLAGVIMPSNGNFRRLLSEKIEDLSLLLLLPLFFVFTGLRTEIGLLNEGNLWFVCLGVIGVAVFGKFFGSSVAAKLVGQNWKDSLSIGALMNTRGLMELVVLNIGYDLGILSPPIFAMMVLMALATTFMTGPILDLLNLIFYKGIQEERGSKILLSFAAPTTGARLLELANLLFPFQKEEVKETKLVALHVTSSTDISPQEADTLEKEVFENLTKKANELGRSILTVYKNSSNVTKEIFNQIQKLDPSLVLLGRSQTLFSHKEVAGKVLTIIESTKIPVGILIDRKFTKLNKILFFVSSVEDRFLEVYQENISKLSDSDVTVLWTGRVLPEWLKDANERIKSPNFRILARERSLIYGENWSDYDLVILSLEFYVEIENTSLFQQQLPSVLILKK
ncbi:cation:proton antiporter [Leptospira sp. 201903070]|uniref:Cation:proton antiporter n=1 Tax=Leptospira ainlahdjerensis TaxID=2810033 RepID=A0ABS2UCP3_9LEPT|nr:cation:proton antiporter [Leptospira ainlahdjerensis]MBM9578136.1 cation:proton antiporter [Leptospira ainlahdjerensis]